VEVELYSFLTAALDDVLKEAPVPTWRDARWALGLICRFWRRVKSLPRWESNYDSSSVQLVIW
jgi:hypothetical protein